MAIRPGPTCVVAPDGVEWRVGRRWLGRRPRWSRDRFTKLRSDSVSNIDGVGLADLSGLDLGESVLVIAAIVAAALILIPLLFFGIELIIVGVLLAGGVLARTLFGVPWVVQASSSNPATGGRQLEWRVRGWRKSGRLIAEVAGELEAGREPAA